MMDRDECAEMFSAFFAQCEEATIILDGNELITQCNPSMKRLTGCLDEQLLGKTLKEAIRMKDAPNSPSGQHHSERQLIRSDGAERYVRIQSLDLSRFTGLSEAIIFHDTTRERQAESSRRKSDWLVGLIMGAVEEMVLVLDRQNRVVKANKAACQILNRSEDRLSSTSFPELVHPAVRNKVESDLCDCCSKGTCIPIQSILQSAQGSPVHVKGTLVCSRDNSTPGSPMMRIVVLRKVERKALALGLPTEVYPLLEGFPQGVLLLDNEQLIRYANESACVLLGRPLEKILNAKLSEFRSQDQTIYLKTRELGPDGFNEPLHYELDIDLPDRSCRKLKVTSKLQQLENSELQELLVLSDQTAQKSAEMDMVKQFAFTSALEEIGDVINGKLDDEGLFRPVLDAMSMFCDALHSCVIYRQQYGAPLANTIDDFPKFEGNPTNTLAFLQQHAKLSQVIDHGEKLVVNRPATVLSFKNQEPLPKWGASFAAIPVVARGDLVAVLYAFTSKPEGITRSALLRMEQLAAHCGTVMNNILLYRQLEEKNRLLEEALNRLAQSSNFLEGDLSSFLQQLDETANEIKRESNDENHTLARRISDTVKQVRDTAKDIYHI